ncbi:glycosyltransferase family 39 protein [Myxococcota bacterium]|nr:glycosyltransferase family 39 protein [Myxococcota bacterium]
MGSRVAALPALAVGAGVAALAASNLDFLARHTLPPVFDEGGFAFTVERVGWRLREVGFLGTVMSELYVPSTAELYPPMARIHAIPFVAALGGGPGAARLSQLLPAALALAATYSMAAARAGRAAGLLAAGFLLAMPGFVGYSRVLKEDLAAAAWVAATAAAMMAAWASPGAGRVLGVGLALAAALLSKQSAAAYLALPALLLGIRLVRVPRRGPALAALAALPAAVLVVPWYANHAPEQRALVAANAIPPSSAAQVAGDVLRCLSHDLLPPAAGLVGAASLVLLWARPTRPGWALLTAATLPPLLAISPTFAWENSRYLLPLLPFLAVAAADALTPRAETGRALSPRRRVAAAALGAATLAAVAANLRPRPVEEGAVPPWRVHEALQRTGHIRPLAARLRFPDLAYAVLADLRRGGVARVGVLSPTLGTELFVGQVASPRGRHYGMEERISFEWDHWEDPDPVLRLRVSRGSLDRLLASAGERDALLVDLAPAAGPEPAEGGRIAMVPVPGFSVRAEIGNPHTGLPVLLLTADRREGGTSAAGGGAFHRLEGVAEPPPPGRTRYVALFDPEGGPPPAEGAPLPRLPAVFTTAGEDGSYRLEHLRAGRYLLATFTLGEGSAPGGVVPGPVDDLHLPAGDRPLVVPPGPPALREP